MLPTRLKTQTGFTLVEMLIALTIMAVMAGLSWQGLEAMSKSRQNNQSHHEHVLAITTGLAQWGTDLDATQATPPLPVLEFNESWLRMTRRSALHDATSESLIVVAYARAIDQAAPAGHVWLRWQSEPARTVAQLQTRWVQAKTWAEVPVEQKISSGVTLLKIQNWRLLLWREGAWQALAPGVLNSTPESLRLELDLPTGAALSGTLQRDWIAPTAGGTR